MEQKGILKVIGAVEGGTSKAGKAWSKQQIVIEFKDGSYDKLLAFDIMKAETIKFIELLKVGQEITVKYNAESREYNGKYFTNLSAWRIEVDGAAEPTAQTATPVKDDSENSPF